MVNKTYTEAQRKRQPKKVKKAPPKKRKQPKGGYPPVPSKSVR